MIFEDAGVKNRMLILEGFYFLLTGQNTKHYVSPSF